MKLAWWPHTRRRSVASYRLRCWQIVTELQRRGVQAGLFDPGQPPQVLVLSKRYDADSLATAIDLRRRHGTRLVLDLCDNHFFDDSGDAVWQRRKEALCAAVQAVDRVVTSTPALADVVRENADRPMDIQVVGDAAEPPWLPGAGARLRHPLAELALHRLARALAQQAVPRGRRLVWFGNHGSGYAEGGMSDLARLRSVLEQAQEDAPLSLTVVSNHRGKFAELVQHWRLPTHYLAWHPSTFSRALQLHDVAVIPIGLNPFTLCKTNNRVATAFLHGLAVVADTIPSYAEFADSAVLDDWGPGLRRLLADDAWRQQRLALGRHRVQTHWSLPGIADQWQRALSAPADRPESLPLR